MARKLFRTDFIETPSPNDPESLFRDLKDRSQDIKHLWSHQADLLREYNERHIDTPDVAFELPTGTGKTLVGLLIAEFTRRKFQERAVYLCPTRQLANQVGAQAKTYGIPAVVLVGKQRDYPASDFTSYTIHNSIAVTTYSAIFNVNPRINDPQIIILDDAHAAENYISDLWSVKIGRAKNTSVYMAILDLYASIFPSAFSQTLRLSEPTIDQCRLVDMVPGKYLRENLNTLHKLLCSSLEEREPAWYSWQTIQNNLQACNLFINWDTVLIRPIIPPTRTHTPFSGARQRLYMSATLGAGGELERISGVREIQRLAAPQGWDKQSAGRRLFLLPGISLAENEALETALDVMSEVPRILVLVPNELALDSMANSLESRGIQVLRSGDIEDSLDSFIKSENAALILANRYDGLDLPHEACRLLVLYRLPGGINLQECFLLTRLKTSSVLRDRILTRFTQAAGRCTRSDTDYSCVLLLCRNLVDFIIKSENRIVLHPELQAELHFGIENSKVKSESDFKVLLRAFLEKSDEWSEAEAAIVSLRSQTRREEDPSSALLRSVVSDEVDYLYAIWSKDYATALEKAQSISDKLTGDIVKAYRGWWYYIRGDSALILHNETNDSSYLNVAADSFHRASRCSLAVSWFAELSRLAQSQEDVEEQSDAITAFAAEHLKAQLIDLCFEGSRFENQVGVFLQNIAMDEHKAFHKGLKRLGELLGFEAEIPPGDGAPDCVWSIGDTLYISFEAKTEQTPNDPISISDTRQAQGHGNWVEANRDCSPEATILRLIVTPRASVAKDALPHCQKLYHVGPGKMREIAQTIVSMLRSIRSQKTKDDEQELCKAIEEALAAKKLRPPDLVELFTRQPVSKMTIK